jgi:hypothetical protein
MMAHSSKIGSHENPSDQCCRPSGTREVRTIVVDEFGVSTIMNDEQLPIPGHEEYTVGQGEE